MTAFGSSFEDDKVARLPGTEPLKITATPYVWRPANQLPRQQWLYGFELQRGHLSALIAPGAAGKSTLLMARALCMVTGNGRFRQKVWNGPHRVWLWNLEDKRIHLERMLQAFCLRWNITGDDIGDRLFLDSAVKAGPGEGDYEPHPLKVATEGQGGATINRPVIAGLIAELKARGIDHLDVDPFVSSHSVNENDNGMIDAISKEWAYVAAEANCSISLAHHVRKFEGRDATAFDARGAVAMINAARSVLVINPMDKDQADACGIKPADRTHYFRVIDGKANRAPASLIGDWFKKVGVGLGNGNDEGPEDNVAAVEGYRPPDAFGGLSVAQLRYVQQMIDTHPDDSREHISSPKWVGRVIADALSLSIDLPSDKSRVQLFLRTWLDNGILETEVRNVRGEGKKFVVVGRWVEEDDPR